jgi:hypothetical protein
VAELDGEVVGNVLIMEDGWGPFFFRLAVNGVETPDGLQKSPKNAVIRELEVD